jgi:hypothetical protein
MTLRPVQNFQELSCRYYILISRGSVILVCYLLLVGAKTDWTGIGLGLVGAKTDFYSIRFDSTSFSASVPRPLSSKFSFVHSLFTNFPYSLVCGFLPCLILIRHYVSSPFGNATVMRMDDTTVCVRRSNALVFGVLSVQLIRL